MRRLGGALVVVAVLLTACGSADTEDTTDQGEQSAADFNEADVLFAQMMIPHHEQAIEMAELALDRAESQEGMSDEEMASLEAASGAELNEMFLTQMREHHMGAVMMAEEELETGQFPEAMGLAQTIIDTQQAEIEEIDRLLEG